MVRAARIPDPVTLHASNVQERRLTGPPDRSTLHYLTRDTISAAYDSPVPSVILFLRFHPFADPMRSISPLINRVAGRPVENNEMQATPWAWGES